MERGAANAAGSWVGYSSGLARSSLCPFVLSTSSGYWCRDSSRRATDRGTSRTEGHSEGPKSLELPITQNWGVPNRLGKANGVTTVSRAGRSAEERMNRWVAYVFLYLP
jgi:hypothetical protein